ncbi:MAG: TatD family hydrolase, partial [Candidatus Thiodiazotropha taylori]|nr:TatD family hydrolase [Candidatus Thiodiazotropha taylori]MCW4336965.1 TatD family hydrolase [Candidatus Thiodiazotropha endolucinida]
MNGLFLFICQELGLGSLPDLLEFVASMQLPPSTLKFLESEFPFLQEYDRRAGLEPLTAEEYMIFPPVRLIVVSNYLIMTQIMQKMSVAARIALKSVHQYVMIDGSRPPLDHPTLTGGIIDSHFHMELLSYQYLTPRLGLRRLMTSQVRLLFAIANYVFPEKWPRIGVQMGRDSRLKFTLGVHPHMITDVKAKSLFQKLKDKLDEFPEAVGIGEVGLDFTTTCRCKQKHNRSRCAALKLEAQRQFLRLTFQLAKGLDKVIVIHVRDDGSGIAAKEVLTLLLEFELSEARIHRHCFVGGEEEYRQWSTSLPNCYFSISSASLKDGRTKACLSVMEKPDRLIIETDAPYLSTDPISVY